MHMSGGGVERAATPRFETVDLLRGLSILTVVLLHCWVRFAVCDVKMGTGLPRWLSHLLLRNGGNGVTVFFAISGFLITLTSVRRFGGLSHMRPRRFYRIRFARIAPLDHDRHWPGEKLFRRHECNRDGLPRCAALS